MAERSVVVRLKAEIGQYQAAMRQAAAATTDFGRNMTGTGKAARADIEAVGRGALIMAGGLAVGLGLAAKAAIDWESAWAGVTKTVDGSASEMAALEGGLRDLAKELPATHGEIAAVAEAAGQLGIQRGAIEGFTRTMIDLGETTNLTADQAATGLARMANIMQTPQADIERMASTLVELGNAGASTETEILDMSLRIAGAAKVVGITEAETLGFAEALSSVGVEAEAGGTAISRTFSTIASAVADGGDDLAGFAEVAGMSSAEFAKAFRDDAAGATVAFIEGLGGITAAGGNVFATLQNLELGDIRVRDALIRASGAGDMFRDSLARASKEWEVNNALQTEAEKRYDTTAAKLEIARNNVVDLGIDIGGVLLPAVAGAAEAGSQMARGFGELPGPLQGVAVGLAGVATAGLGAIGVVGTLGPKVKVAHDALMGMGTGAQFVGRNMGRMAIGLGVAGVALATFAYLQGESARKGQEAEDRIKGFTDAIREAGDAASGTEAEIGRLISENRGLSELMEATGTSVSDMADALQGSDADFNAFAAELRSSAEAAGVSDEALHALAFGLDDLREAAPKGAEAAERLNRQLDGTGDAAFDLTPKLGGLADGLGLTAEQAEAAEKEFKELTDAYRAAVDPLFAMLDALDGNRGAQDALSAAVTANADAIDDNNVSAEEMAALYRDVATSALDVEVASRDLAKAVQDGTVSVEQGAAMLGEWVSKGLMTEEQAANVAWQFGIAAGKADEFSGDYVANAFANTAGAEDAIARVNRQLDGIDGRRVTVTVAGQILGGDKMFMPQRKVATGGITSYAAGGLDAHVAAGELIRYGEPQTGGEAFIPRLGNAARSRQILEVAAGWYGMEVVQGGARAMFTGGPVSAAGHQGGGGGTTTIDQSSTTTTIDQSKHIAKLVVQTHDSPRRWLDEGAWQVAGL